MSPQDDGARGSGRRPGPGGGGSGGDARRPDGGSPDRRDATGRERGAARSAGRTTRTASAPAARRRDADPARGAAFDVLREVDGSDAYANLVLPPLLRERGITGRDAGFATELAYGALRLRGRYDAIIEQCAGGRTLDRIDPPVLDLLRLGAHQLLGMRVPPHAAVSETVGLARARTGAGSAQFVNAVLRAVSAHDLATWLERIGDAVDPAGTDAVARLSVTQSHPVWVTRGLREALVGHGRAADEIEALLTADNAAPGVTLVARPGLVDVDEVREQARLDTAPGRWSPYAVAMSGGDPGALPAVRDGRAGVQDEGSQLVALALAGAPWTVRTSAGSTSAPDRGASPHCSRRSPTRAAPASSPTRCSRTARASSSGRWPPSRPRPSRRSASGTAAPPARTSPAPTTACSSMHRARGSARCGAVRSPGGAGRPVTCRTSAPCSARCWRRRWTRYARAASSPTSRAHRTSSRPSSSSRTSCVVATTSRSSTRAPRCATSPARTCRSPTAPTSSCGRTCTAPTRCS